MKNARTSILALTLALLPGRAALADATSELWAALKGANDAAALAAIAKGPDLKKLDPAFGTPLNYASCFAGPEVIKALIEAKSEVNFVAPVNGHTPLVNAAAWGNTEAVKTLLAAGATVKGRTKLGQPFLVPALGGGKLEIIKLLVEAGADPKEQYRMPPLQTDLNLLHALVANYEPAEKVKNLASLYANLQKLGITYPARLLSAKASDFTPFEETTAYLLSKGLDPNQKGLFDAPVLFAAAQLGKAGIVKGLIGKVDLNQRIAYRTALWIAADKGYGEIVEALVEAKANLELEGIVRGNLTHYLVTPVMAAAANGHERAVETLCKGGAALNKLTTQTSQTSSTVGTITTTTRSWEHNTALSLAIGGGHQKTAAILMKYGAKGPKEL